MTLPRTSSEKGSPVVLSWYLFAHGSARELSGWRDRPHANCMDSRVDRWSYAGNSPDCPQAAIARGTARKMEARHDVRWEDGGNPPSLASPFID
jgi:hypothetical protein